MAGSNRTYIGDPVGDGSNEVAVYIEHWANEAPDTVAIDGPACLVFFDPGTKVGREAIFGLIANLAKALTAHDQAVEDIYAELRPGDDATRIRVACKGEVQCRSLVNGTRCVRVDHADGHHVTIVDTAHAYEVSGVRRETYPAAPSPLPSS